MKLLFRGWGREVTQHRHVVSPVEFLRGKYFPKKGEQSLRWSGPLRALGKVTGLRLTGSFLVEFTFEEQELRSWLQEYVKAHPASALRLLAEMQAEAIIALGGRARPDSESE